MSTKIGVIESKWHDAANDIKKNTTVKPLFDFLSDLHFGHHHAYDYQMVGTRDAFDDALSRISRSKTTTVAYIAMHGSDTGLHLHGGNIISRVVLKNSLSKVSKEDGSNLVGMFLGSCTFGSHDLADYLFEKEVPVVWIAGYKGSIDFVSSSGLDLLFFNTMLAVRDENSEFSPRKNIIEVARRMRLQMQGLCNTPKENADDNCGLGFSIFVRKMGPRGGAQDLMKEL